MNAYYADKTAHQGSYRELIFLLSGDHTARALTFVCKVSATDTTNLFTLNNTIAGGSDSEIAATYSETTGKTTVTVKLGTAQTSLMTYDKHYYNLNTVSNSGGVDNYTAWLGYVKMLAQSVTINDSASVSGFTPYLSQTHDRYLELEITAAGAVSIINKFGWAVTLDAANSVRLDEGYYKATFNEEILDTDNYKFDVSSEVIDADSFEVFATIKHDIISTTEIRFKSFDQNWETMINTAFRVIIKRVKT